MNPPRGRVERGEGTAQVRIELALHPPRWLVPRHRPTRFSREGKSKLNCACVAPLSIGIHSLHLLKKSTSLITKLVTLAIGLR